jgi:hypothetical protein
MQANGLQVHVVDPKGIQAFDDICKDAIIEVFDACFGL